MSGRYSFVIVRLDMAPRAWWDGYYDSKTADEPGLAAYWSRELGVVCFAMKAEFPDLPDSGYHGGQ